jgi:nitrite reductase/ring-hydroxylating ferredoxin subunit
MRADGLDKEDVVATKSYKRNPFQRILGIPQTRVPANADCWRLEDGKLSLDLERAPELAEEFGAIRIEAASLPHPVLVMRDGRGRFRAFRNKCSHGGRRLDPVPGTETLCCCSVGKSTFDYDGKVLSGSAKAPIDTFAVEVREKRLLIQL